MKEMSFTFSFLMSEKAKEKEDVIRDKTEAFSRLFNAVQYVHVGCGMISRKRFKFKFDLTHIGDGVIDAYLWDYSPDDERKELLSITLKSAERLVAKKNGFSLELFKEDAGADAFLPAEEC